MENKVDNSNVNDDVQVPRYEPWLGVAASSFVPIGVMFILPSSFVWPMIGLAGLVLLTSIVMLIRQERLAKPEA